MFLFFSFGSYATRLATTTMRCGRCRRDTPHELRESGQRLAVFFIPVWKVSRRFSLTCTECGAGQVIPEQTATAIRRGETLPSRNPFDLR